MSTTFDKKIESLSDENFQYGFALLDMDYHGRDYNCVGRIVFYTKEPSNNIVRFGIDRLGFEHNNFVSIDLDIPSFEFEEIKPTIEKMNIVETLKFCLEKYPEQTLEILRSMPTGLYENKEIAENIFSSIQRTPKTMDLAKTALQEKMNVFKAYRIFLAKTAEKEARAKKKPDELYKDFLNEYNTKREEAENIKYPATSTKQSNTFNK